MSPGSTTRRLGRVLLLGVSLAVTLGVALEWASGPASRSPEGNADTLGDYGVVPDFALVERSGGRWVSRTCAA